MLVKPVGYYIIVYIYLTVCICITHVSSASNVHNGEFIKINLNQNRK